MNLNDIAREMRRLSGVLNDELAELRSQAQKKAEAEHAYRKAVALAWLDAPEGTVPEREAHVNAECADLRFDRDLAEGSERAALEGVRNARQQLSAVQSWLAAHRAEAEFVRTGQDD